MSSELETFYLDLYLTVTSGSFDIVGQLQLFCWLKAFRAPGFEQRGHLVVVHPSAPDGALLTREQDVEAGRAEALVRALQGLEFPDRSPRVEPVFDTSDIWEHVVLRLTLNDATASLDLGLFASGFDGEDAEGLREVFRRLLDAAGLREHADWRSLTGELGV